MASLIPLHDPQGATSPRIIQLYENLELFSEGEPPANGLFVLARVPEIPLSSNSLWREQLLIVDPPADVSTRFRVEGDIATIFTGEPVDVGLPQVQTLAGGVAHIRIGEHFLDVYAQRHGAIVHLPTLGIVVGGDYGSDVLPVRLAAGSDGQDELATLRLLAHLLKAQHFQLYIPRIGTLAGEKAAAMERLATDVAYLHGLRRVVPALAQRGEALETVERMAASLLPAGRRSLQAEAVHEVNLRNLLARSGTT